MTIVLDVSFNDQSNSDSQNSAINEISRKKVKEKHNAKAIKVAKVKNKVSGSDEIPFLLNYNKCNQLQSRVVKHVGASNATFFRREDAEQQWVGS